MLFLRGCTSFLAISGVILLAAHLRADSPAPAGDEFFEKQVRPLLVERCQKCHSGDEPKGSLLLTSRANVLKGGENGPAAVPGNPEESLLVMAIRYDDEPKMPPKEKLSDPEIATLTRWVEMGLPGTRPAPRLWHRHQASRTSSPPSNAGSGRSSRFTRSRLPR